MFLFFGLGSKISAFSNIRKYKEFLNTKARKFHFPKYNFFFHCFFSQKRHFFRAGFLGKYIFFFFFFEGGGGGFWESDAGKCVRVQQIILLTNIFLKTRKRSWTSPPVSFSAWLLKEKIFLVIFLYLTKFHCLVAFTSWDIWQYVYF